MKKVWKKCLKLYKKYEEIINYLIVGGLTTVVSLGSYYLCILTFILVLLFWAIFNVDTTIKKDLKNNYMQIIL